MTTLHFSKDDFEAMVTDDEGGVTIELTDAAMRALEVIVAKRIARRERNVVSGAGVQVAVSPGLTPDAGFAAGVRVGYEYGRGPGTPPLRA